MTGVGQRLGSGGPYEERWGYSRVVRVGPLAVTAGCTSIRDGVVVGVNDPAVQARTAITTGLQALAEVGLGPEHVIQTRMYLTDLLYADAVGAVHGEIFGDIRPVSSMLGVTALADPQMLFEIELTAWAPLVRPGSGAPAS